MIVLESKVADIEHKLEKVDGKVDAVIETLNEIKNTLSRQEGADFPRRLAKVEADCQSSELHRAEVTWIPSEVSELRKQLDGINNWKYTVTGGLILLSIAIPLLIKFFAS